MQRRTFLARSALAAGAVLLHQRVAFANASGDPRLVLVILRGALDGLAAVPPYGDADYSRLRGELALPAPGAPQGALRLDGTFALHPKLEFLHESYGADELAVFHAIATDYRERSHFDGQDVLESGCRRPHASQTGWLNRALHALPAASVRGRQELGVALGQNVPLVMRGPSEVASWSPSKLAALDEDTLQRVSELYARDTLLAQRLADALAADDIVSQQTQDPSFAMQQAGSQEGGRCALCGNRARRGGFLAPRRRPARRGIRYRGLGHARQRGCCTRRARRPPCGARCGIACPQTRSRSRLARYRGRGDHGIRSHGRHQRHAGHGSRYRLPWRSCSEVRSGAAE